MRINKYVAQATGMSRRAADEAITHGRVAISGKTAQTGQTVDTTDTVTLDERIIDLPTATTTIMLHKPVGYVCSRNGQGSKTVYDLLPKELHHLKPVGRLDKDSSGLLLLSDDGELANRLTHPSFHKDKIYEITLSHSLSSNDKQRLGVGIQLPDGISSLRLEGEGNKWRVTIQEGRNRQIRRTLAALGYTVTTLHRIQFGRYTLGKLAESQFQLLES